MSYRQIMFLRFADGTPDAAKDELMRSMRAMPERIEVLQGVQVATGTGDGFDLGVVLDFADADAFAAYVSHPAHQAVVAQVRAIIVERVGGQFELE